MKKYVIIVAGGQGKRMKSKVLKQFLCLKGFPVLMHTIKAFYEYQKDIEIILVLPKDETVPWKKLCKKYKFNIPHKLTIGGSKRFYSVKNGLSLINENDCLIAVHDGVRPLVSDKTIQKVFEAASKYGTAVPCVTLNDSLRILTENTNTPLDRNKIRAIQTPQCFKADILIKAYKQKYNRNFTDDATVVESLNIKIKLVEGNEENIKITTQKDILIAEAF